LKYPLGQKATCEWDESTGTLKTGVIEESDDYTNVCVLGY
jgi:hypothetical protein